MNTTTYQEWAINLKGLNEKTVSQYKGYLASLPEEPTQQDINKLLWARNKSYIVIKAALNSYKDFITICYPEKKINWEVPKRTGKSEPLPDISKRIVGIEKILDYIYPLKRKLIVLIMLKTGSRISEVLNLQRKDIDLKNRTIRGIGKHNKNYCRYLSPKIIPLLEEYLQNNNQDQPFHQSRSWAWRWIKKAAREANLPQISCHWLRHSFAHELKDRGYNIEKIRKLLGHTRISTTQRYINEDETEIWHKYITEEEEAKNEYK